MATQTQSRNERNESMQRSQGGGNATDNAMQPFDYPPVWGWRAYNEQQGVLPLMATGAYAPLFSSVWAHQRLGERLAQSVVARLPLPKEAMSTSLWLEKQ